MHVKCPSGLIGEVRKLKGSEANILADRKAAKKGETYDKILSACWLSTDGVGPYEDFMEEGDKPPPWGKILICDRYYALAAMRIATYGADYFFPVKCADRMCEEQFEWEINIENDLEVVDLPKETIEKIRAGDNAFDCEIEGLPVKFKLMTGKDEIQAGRRVTQNKDQLITTALSSRILSIGDIDKRPAVHEKIKDLGADSQWELLSLIEEVDGGIDQQIEIECPECSHIFEFNVPFEGAAFWVPSSRKRLKKKRKQARKGRTRRMSGETPEEELEEEDL